MAIDRTELLKQLNSQQERRQMGGMAFFKANTTHLRVLEFSADGKDMFARPWVTHVLQGDGKKHVICRMATFGAPCAACRLEEIASDAGQDSPYMRKQTRYLANAFDINAKPPKIASWALPSTVWEAIAGYLCTDDWADVLDPAKGHAFIITKTGSGLGTEYDIQVTRNPLPVGGDVLKQVADPYAKSPDPGLERQCEMVGTTMADLFADPGALEMVESVTGDGASAAAPPARNKPAAAATPKPGTAAKPGAPKPGAKPATPAAAVTKPKPGAPKLTVLGQKVGDRVTRDFDGTLYAGVIKKVINEENVEVEFDDGDLMECAATELTAEGEAAPAEEAATEETPGGFQVGDRVQVTYGEELYVGAISSIKDPGGESEVFVVDFDDGSRDELTGDLLTPEAAPEGEAPEGADTLPFTPTEPPKPKPGAGKPTLGKPAAGNPPSRAASGPGKGSTPPAKPGGVLGRMTGAKPAAK